MRAASRAALDAAATVLDEALAEALPGQQLGDELFAATALLDSEPALRRALSNAVRSAQDRSALADRIFGGRVSEPAQRIITTLAAQRWSSAHDLTEAMERLAVRAVLSSAAKAGRADAVEDELFRFERVVAGDSDLRAAVTDRHAPAGPKAELISRLLDGKVAPETLQLARQTALAPRGRRFDRIMQTYLRWASELREQATAVVTAATALDDAQKGRLASALSRIYDRPVHVNVVVDPAVLGGIRVQIGDETIDGTIVRRLDDARRTMTS